MVHVTHKPQNLAKLCDLVAEGIVLYFWFVQYHTLTGFQGKLKAVVDSVYRFEDALSAYERLMTSRATGKVVIKVDESVG